jgi:DNA repair exonuclease SbcCD ATPase subunit
MEIAIRNMRGVTSADLEVGSITLVAGDNGAGKSSIALAVAAALTRSAAPVPGMQKQQVAQLLREGEARGYCEVVGDAGAKVRVSWPGGAVSAEEDAPEASVMACGLESVVGLKPKDAAALLVKLLDLHPTLAQLSAALPDVDPAMIDAIWQVVEAEGFDAAHKRAQEKGAKAKGGWEHCTGENYGSQKAANWTHPLYDEILWASVDRLEAEVTAAGAELQRLQAGQAMDSVQRGFLEDQAQGGRTALARLRELEPEQNKLAAKVGELRLQLRDLPQPETAAELPPCPHCGKPVVVFTATQLHKPTPALDAKENKRREQVIAAKRAQVVEAEDALDLSDREVARLRPTIQQGQLAEKRLEHAPADGASAEHVAGAQQRLTDASAALQGFQAQLQAEAYHDKVKAMQAVAAALAPDGLRKKVLGDRLNEFNDHLAELSVAADWEPVAIGDDLGIWYGGTPYWLASASEQFRVRVVLQLALTTGFVIIDGADILGRSGRNGLFRLLHHTLRPALVCMTLLSQQDLPDLAKVGYGRSYWIEAGELQAS